MPYAPKPPCSLPGCNSTATRHGYCARHQSHTYDAKRGTAHQRGYDAAWNALRTAYKQSIGNQCEIVVDGKRCAHAVAEVHHMWPVRTHQALRLVWANLRGLCISHHRYAEADTQRRGEPPEWVRARDWSKR